MILYHIISGGVKRQYRLEPSLASGSGKKEPATTYSRTGGSRTTLGDGAFDFRVRNGNGYGSSSMVTGKSLKLGTKENHNPTRGGKAPVVKS